MNIKVYGRRSAIPMIPMPWPSRKPSKGIVKLLDTSLSKEFMDDLLSVNVPSLSGTEIYISIWTVNYILVGGEIPGE